MFYPRGGSSHAARALARGLRAQGHELTLLAGSRPGAGLHSDAREFYGEEVHAVDFGPALSSADPMRFAGPPGTAPMHPSFEDRPGAPDRVFAALDDLDYERQVQAWARELALAGAAEADMLHLHHLTPLNEAAARVAPHVPLVGQLHGTELLMLEQIAAGAPPAWRYAERWAARMCGWAARCDALIAAPGSDRRASKALELGPERLVALPNGVDTVLFAPSTIDRERFWNRVLCEAPKGALPGQPSGSVRYRAADVARLAPGGVLLYVGRFTEVKRLDLLLEAFAAARSRSVRECGLVLAGGHPGEWEGEHPAVLADQLGARQVFLAGWYTHEDLPDFFRASDAVVLSSAREQFGQALVEGMACGLPAIATRSLGPEVIVANGVTGWLTPAGDVERLAQAMRAAIDDPAECARRGRAARRETAARFSWSAIAAQLSELLERVAVRPSQELAKPLKTS